MARESSFRREIIFLLAKSQDCQHISLHSLWEMVLLFKYFVTISSFIRLYYEEPPKMTEKEFNLYSVKIRPKLVAFASTFSIAGAMEVEDLVQEALIRVWNEGQKEGKSIKNYDGFAIVALRNICLDYLRKKKFSELNELVVVGESNPHQNVETNEAIRSIGKVLKTLPIDQQMVIRLRDVIGYDFKEIAEILLTSEANVRTLLSRARKSIREFLIKKEN